MARNDFFLSCFVQEVGEVPIGRNVIFYHDQVAVGVVFSCFCFTKLPFLSPLQIVRLACVNPSRPFVGRGVDLLLLRLVLSCIYHCERRQSSFTTFDRHALLARWRGCLRYLLLMLNCTSTEDGRNLTDVLFDQLYLIHNHLSFF